MTEDQIERAVELRMDRLDARFLSSSMTQAEYDAEVEALNLWAECEGDKATGRIETFTNADTGMQARVFACKSGFRVQLFDLDSQEALPYLKTYADREKAYRCASHWAGADLD